MYVDGMIFAVPSANRDLFTEGARRMAKVLREHGATRVVECWGDDVPGGRLTSMRAAVHVRDGEVVCFSWVEYPDRETRDRCRAAAGEEMQRTQGTGSDTFDGKRLIWGGFRTIVDV